MDEETAHRALTEAIGHYRAGHHDVACALHHAILSAFPAHVDALQLLGLALYRKNELAAALAQIGRALRLRPGEPALIQNLDFVVGGTLGSIGHLVDEKRYAEAAALCRAILRVRPDQPQAWLALATALGVEGDLEGAEVALSRIAPGQVSDEKRGGMARFLRAQAHDRDDQGFVGTIVVPMHNMADYIERSLDSIVHSIRFHRDRSGDAGRFRIAVVDDNSTDGGAAVALAWARRQDEPGVDVTLLTNPRNIGAGWSRNLGAATATGRYLWFLDADDFYFEPHIHLCVDALDRHPYAGYVRTGKHFQGIDADISVEFRTQSENTYPCNMAVRLECHRFVGGFPEAEMFFPNTSDDVAYSRCLESFFICARTSVPTVHYTIRPGNAMDVYLKSKAATEQGGPSQLLAGDRWVATELYIRRRLRVLRDKLSEPWSGPPLITDGRPRMVAYTPPAL
ncbi:glycosyltransferase family 2 protein [Azospirillum agricola]|uniref:glycosyltransferase family 2 protein n=1 Tax=Azospirillum agricola TaxID=1720247 RepID=UPI000A0EF1CB|nr:glycosyltransferase family 2 protein [Azospirillum agricola]SMH41171.1 Tetratricopeptide repeat-containing protein [Azospirillum lipoferum]